MLTPEEVTDLPYVDLLARIGESNRPPGGVDTIRRLISAAHLRPGVRVLHAGCNAGFLSRELARRSGATIHGIDINASMVAAAQSRASEEGLTHLLSYEQADMRHLPFPERSFDVVLSGGALAFVGDGPYDAVTEWARVVRPHGLLADCELFYRTSPPQILLRQVSDIIGVEVPEYKIDHWLRLFNRPLFERYYLHVSEDNLARGNDGVEAYVEAMTDRLSQDLDEQARNSLRDRLRYTFRIFDENMYHLGYALFIYVVRPPGFEPALYP